VPDISRSPAFSRFLATLHPATVGPFAIATPGVTAVARPGGSLGQLETKAAAYRVRLDQAQLEPLA